MVAAGGGGSGTYTGYLLYGGYGGGLIGGNGNSTSYDYERCDRLCKMP